MSRHSPLALSLSCAVTPVLAGAALSMAQVPEVFAVLGALALAVGLALFSASRASRGSSGLVASLRELTEADLDLTRRFATEGRGEWRDAAILLNAFLEKVQRTSRSLASRAAEIAGAATELTACTTEMAGNLDEQRRQSDAGAAAEEIAANMNSMAKASDQASATFRTIAAATEGMSQSIADVANRATHAANVAQRAASLGQSGNELMQRLGTAADEVGKVVGVIQDIAEQTNLLALNATIEAARAGEAGKGFAVVASEVKELARQTGEATQDIRKRIEGIQESSTKAVAAIEEINAIIGEVSESSHAIAATMEQQTISTREVSQGVAHTANTVRVIATGIGETATASGEITANVSRTCAALDRATTGANDSTAAGVELTRRAEALRAAVMAMGPGPMGFDVATIKAAHSMWKRRLAELLAGRATMDPSEVTDHRSCAFGKWYLGDGREQFANMPTFRAIDPLHARVHELAREITRHHAARQQDDARRLYSELQEVTKALFATLDRLAAEVEVKVG